MNRKLGLIAASAALSAAAAIAAPASAQAASAAGTSPNASTAAVSTPVVAATWQWTGEYYSTYSRCMADADYYLGASNVYGYRCVKSGSLWGGQVYAD
ncbi:hypothetical protein ACWC0A_02850 [Streptomyces scopuliridis]